MARRRPVLAALAITPALLLPILPPAPVSAAGAVEVLALGQPAGVAVSDPAGAPPALIARGATGPDVDDQGTKLVWMQSGTDHRYHLHVGGLDGSGARQVTSGSAEDLSPAWSPDGTTIALVRSGAAGPVLALVRADGTGGRTIPGTEGAGAPTWSPDGRFLAYPRGRDVVAVTPDGRHSTVLLTSPVGQSAQVAWSPEGDRLALTRYLTSDDTAVTVRDLRTGEESEVARGFSYRYTYTSAAWSRDGAHLWVGQRADAGPSDDPEQHSVARHDLTGATDRPLEGRTPSAGGGPALQPVGRDHAPVTDLRAAPSASAVRLSWQPVAGSAGVTVRVAAGTTPPAAVTDGLAAGDSLGSSLVAARLAPSSTYAFSVFTRDWAGGSSPAATVTATTPAEVATTLRLTSSATHLVHGTPLTLSLRLVRDDTGAGLGGAVLDLYGHKRGDPDVLLQRVTTAADGSAVVKRLPSAETRYTFRYAGSAPLLRSAATTVVRVRFRITASFSPTPVARGGRATVTLRVSPATPGLPVSVDHHVGARFLGRQHLRLGSASSVVLPLRTDVSGSHQLYVVTAEGDRIRSGYLATGFTVR